MIFAANNNIISCSAATFVQFQIRNLVWWKVPNIIQSIEITQKIRIKSINNDSFRCVQFKSRKVKFTNLCWSLLNSLCSKVWPSLGLGLDKERGRYWTRSQRPRTSLYFYSDLRYSVKTLTFANSTTCKMKRAKIVLRNIIIFLPPHPARSSLCLLADDCAVTGGLYTYYID